MHPFCKMVRVLTYGLTFVALLLAPTPVRALTHRARIAAPADSELEAVALKDGRTVGLWVQGVSLDAVARALLPIAARPLDIPIELPQAHGHGKSAVGYAQFEGRVESVRSDWRAGAWTLIVKTQTRLEALEKRIETVPITMPHGVDLTLLKQGEHALAEEHIPLARHYFLQATKVYALRAWAELRLADVAYLGGESEAACRLWQKARTHFAERVPGIVAGLRGHVAGCAGAALPNWRALLTHHRHRDDLIGLRLKDEARWALGVEDRIEVLSEVSRLDVDDLGLPLFQQVFSYLVRHASPYAVARAYEQPSAPRRTHPEAQDLAFFAARAFCSLDLQTLAKRTLTDLPKPNWVHLTPLEQQTAAAMLAACDARAHGPDEPARPAAPPVLKLGVNPMTDALASLEERLKTTTTAVEAMVKVAPSAASKAKKKGKS